jgi:uncharacterized protein YecE (DUF72 family)
VNPAYYIGTSGFSYDPWKGVFYPEKIKKDAMLTFYANVFNTVEINNTFYRMPTETLLAGWQTQVPAGFRFAIKTPQRITHIGRLKEVQDPSARFFEVKKVLGEQNGPTLVQLPPNMKIDLDRLSAFLALVPEHERLVFEFGNASWLEAETYAVLRAFGRACLCVVDDEKDRATLVSLGDFAYARLRREVYSDAELEDWTARLREIGTKEQWLFFKHEDAGTGPKLAQRMQSIVGYKG